MSEREQDDAPSGAVQAARTASTWWIDAGRTQAFNRDAASVSHRDFCALACEVVTTLEVLDGLLEVLCAQFRGYGRGRRLADSGSVDSARRLVLAEIEATALSALLRSAIAVGERFWSQVGHIALSEDHEHAERPECAGRGCEACRAVGPLLTGLGTSGRTWHCDTCGTTWTSELEGGRQR